MHERGAVVVHVRQQSPLREPEVEDLHEAVRSQHHVLRLHVAVDDARGLRRGERRRHLERDAALDGDRSARQAGACAARHDGNLVPRRDPDDLRHLLRVHGEDHRVGHGALDRPVALEDPEVVRGGDHLVATRDPLQLVDDRRRHRHQASGASR